MSLSIVLQGIAKEAARTSTSFTDARVRHPELAAFANPAELLAAFHRSSSLAVTERAAIVSALVTEAQRSTSRTWPSLLTSIFAPMLLGIRRRLGRPRDEDLDSVVLVAFLDAVRTIRPSAYTGRGLRLSTLRAVFGGARADRDAAAPLEELDEERHALEGFVDAHESANAAEVIRMIEAEAGGELLDLLLATRAGDETLLDYVARNHPAMTAAQRSAEYERLKSARRDLEEKLRARVRPALGASCVA